jgi:hypothetical protein
MSLMAGKPATGLLGPITGLPVKLGRLAFLTKAPKPFSNYFSLQKVTPDN